MDSPFLFLWVVVHGCFAVNVGKKIVSVVLEKQPMCWVNNLEPLPFHEADQSLPENGENPLCQNLPENSATPSCDASGNRTLPGRVWGRPNVRIENS